MKAFASAAAVSPQLSATSEAGLENGGGRVMSSTRKMKFIGCVSLATGLYGAYSAGYALGGNHPEGIAFFLGIAVCVAHGWVISGFSPYFDPDGATTGR